VIELQLDILQKIIYSQTDVSMFECVWKMAASDKSRSEINLVGRVCADEQVVIK
jgi:hypothetical protein